ncbi:MAG: hypothetical protein ACE5KR_02405 [Candidatus Bipolaricaulia bacterium]
MRAKWCWALVIVILIGGLSALAQGGPSQADLEGILKSTGADTVIEALGNVLIGAGAIDKQVLALGVILGIAAELEEYQGLDVADWFKREMDIDLSKAELNWIDLVKSSLRSGHPDVYSTLQQALKELATKPQEQPGPGTQPGTTDLGQVLALLQGFSQRLSDLEGKVTQLGQPNQEVASAKDLADLKQEVEALKEGLPDQALLAELADAPAQIKALEGEVNRLDRSLAGERGLIVFLIILVILLLAWLVFLRVRELSQAR